MKCKIEMNNHNTTHLSMIKYKVLNDTKETDFASSVCNNHTIKNCSVLKVNNVPQH